MEKKKSFAEIFQDELAKFYIDYLKPDFDGIKKQMRQLFQNQKDLKGYMERRFDKIEAKQADHNTKIDDLQTDLGITPERKDVADLKREVKRLKAFHTN